jgi:hypothetical protein
MSTDSEMPSRPSSSAWLHARALWAGVSITIMWLAVLFIGVFGDNIVSSTPGGTSTSVPVVVALVPFVLAATIVVARRGFKGVRENRQSELDEDTSSGPFRRAG